MFRTKNLAIFFILYISLIIGFIIDENLNFGSQNDWISVYVPPINDFADNFYKTLLSFENYGQRHSPIYIIFLSLLLKLGISFDIIRLIHMHLCLMFIILFYNCLKLKFHKIKKSNLQLLSMFILLSPTFRSLSIWPDSRLPGLIIFVLSIYFFLKFLDGNDKKKNCYAFACAFSLILSSYISPNFSLFSIFYYYFFFYRLNLKNFIFLFIFSVILSLPMLYYIFGLDVNFMMAGKTPSGNNNTSSLSFNFSNKILLVSSILFFHIIPIIYFVSDHKKFLIFIKKNIFYFLPVFITLVLYFDYQTSFTGGGFFFQLSYILFNNNILFYIIVFYILFYMFFISSLSKVNFCIILILIISNIQNTIYHKYYEPLILIIFLLLFQKLNFKNFLSREINILYIYSANLFYIFLRLVKSIYLV